VPTSLLLTMGSIPAGVLGVLALLALRRRRRAAELVGPIVADELDDLAELEADARAVAAAAEQAIAAADEARHRTGQAVQVLDLAGSHYRQVRQHAQAVQQQTQAAENPLRLVERAALNAYRRGDLSATELNRIWEHTQATTGDRTDPADGVPAEWDNRVRAARQRYEQAAVEVTDVHKEEQVTTFAARVLVEEAHVAESQLTAAQRSTSTGLAAFFRDE
jgi:hypothetical protein